MDGLCGAERRETPSMVGAIWCVVFYTCVKE